MIGLDLYNPPPGKIITISDDDLNKIINAQYKVQKSGYYNHWVSWIFKECDDNYVIIQKANFISMTANIKDRVVHKYSKYINIHKMLLRRLYIEEGESEHVFSMGYKRPFGNSHVEGDVRDILVHLGIKVYEDEDAEDNDDNWDLENEILKSFSEFIIDFFNDGFELITHSFESYPREGSKWGVPEIVEKRWREVGYQDSYFHNYMEEWIPCRSEIRNKKLEELGI